MSPTIVDRLHEEFRALVDYLERESQPSFRVTAEENFSKALLLAAASYFENQVVEAIACFAASGGPESRLTAEFVRRKALSRQYHTLFDWDKPNANRFFSLFGESFRQFMQEACDRDSGLGQSIRAFMEIGRERNRLVHDNFGSFAMEKTADEIYGLYGEARAFVETLSSRLGECAQRQSEKDAARASE